MTVHFDTETQAMATTYTVELAQFFNGRFAGWQSFEGFTSRAAAWAFIQSKGYTAADKGDKWMAYMQRKA